MARTHEVTEALHALMMAVAPWVRDLNLRTIPIPQLVDQLESLVETATIASLANAGAVLAEILRRYAIEGATDADQIARETGNHPILGGGYNCIRCGGWNADPGVCALCMHRAL